ncbi:hypothetical protein FRB96_004534 [Tulasnella sp. 330]|nr:hypothetical protein FRB96_004534 [Tulasnella sp. 330]KAG8885658.1 hypothetical protein FRB97_000101 [Tulasnella sp. 331]KAG8890820.1 hypothetical protein FRB98_004865 [Tulasnella sp. 332]
MPFFTTVFARSSKILLEQVQALQLPSASSLLFSVSANTEPSVLSKVVSHFGQDENCIGCLAHSPLQSAVSCAVAAFPSSEVVSFRSTIKGLAPISLGKPRRPANPAAKYDQGGAWFDQLDDHAFKDTKFTNGSFLWGTSNNPNSVHVLPEGLEDVPVASIKNIVYFSDGAPEGLKSALDSRFPLAAQMGLIGSSTPFVTGRPYTLLQGSKVWSDGAVGLAFLKGGLTSTHAFHGYEAFSKTYTVSKAESNLIHSLDDQNPVKQLLAALPAIQGGTSTGSLGSFKDMEIYLGTFTSGSDRIYRLISGGPSKGILALESEDGPTEGTQVRV